MYVIALRDYLNAFDMHAGKELALGKKVCVDHCDEIIVHIPYSECTKKTPPNIGMLRLYKMSE